MVISDRGISQQGLLEIIVNEVKIKILFLQFVPRNVQCQSFGKEPLQLLIFILTLPTAEYLRKAGEVEVLYVFLLIKSAN